MKFIVLFEDAVDADPDIRMMYMKDHLAFLERNADAIDAAGPLTDHAGKGRNGLWIIDAGDEKQVEDLIHEDPFWPTGLRASFSILKWTQVYCDGKRLIDPK